MTYTPGELLDQYLDMAGPEAAIALLEEAIRDLSHEELIPLDQIDPRGVLRDGGE